VISYKKFKKKFTRNIMPPYTTHTGGYIRGVTGGRGTGGGYIQGGV